MQEQLHFEEALGVVICHRCRTGVVVDSANSINNHFRREPHHLKGPALKAVHERFRQWPIRRSSGVQHPSVDVQPVRPIPYLRTLSGWRCRHCDQWLMTDLVNSKTHLRHAHSIKQGQEGRDLERCLLQTLFRAKHLVRYFRVTEDDEQVGLTATPDVETSEIDAFISSQTTILGQIEKEEQANAAKVHAFDAHKSSVIPWVRSCGFDRYLHGFEQKEIRQAFQRPTDDEFEGDLVHQAARMAVQMLEETWQWCVDGPDCRLTRPMAVVLSQFWTEATVHSRGFRVGIEPNTKAGYFGLWANVFFYFWRVSSGRALGSRSATPYTQPSEDCHESIGDVSVATIVTKPLFCGTEQQRDSFDACLEAAATEDEESLRSSIFRFSMAIIQQDLPRFRFDSPLLSHCATQAVNYSSQGWKLPGNFNSSLSGLIYCAQLWIFREAYRIADLNTSACVDETLDGLCRRWLRQEKSTTFGIILNWRLMLFSVAKQQVSSKQATWALDAAEVCYQGTALRMDHVTRLYHHTLSRARLILDRDLLLGANHIPRMSALALHEGEHRQERGWWFGIDPRNAAVLQGSEIRLLEHIKSTPATRPMFLLPNDEWRPAAMSLYEHHVQQFLECVFVLFQLLPPLRGPEAISITWRNTEKSRSIFIKHGRVMVYTTYHKGQAQWGSYKDNVRFPSSALGDMLLDFIVYVLPLRKLFLWNQNQELPLSHLFTADGRVWDEKKLTRVLRACCAAAEVPILSESHWRQICASIIKMKFGEDRGCFAAVNNIGGEENEPTDDDDGEVEEVATLARLSNHTVRTHNRAYANETSLLAANVWDGLIKRSYRACALWSRFFQFEETSISELPTSKRHREESDGTDHRGILKKITLSTSPIGRKHWTGKALLQEVRRIYLNPKMQWRCVEQERATCAIMSGAMELVVVMATGMGKSLLFQLPCALPNAGTTVLIVPLIVLRLDLLRRCRMLGIDCQEWVVDQSTRAPLVFLSVEAAVSEEGRQYLFNLHRDNQLARIVIDECHLILSASSYRRAMGQLALLRSLPVQFVYLTATLPPSMKAEFFRRQHLTQVHEIRASTRRTNLRYEVKHLQPRQNDILTEAATILRQLWAREAWGEPHRALVFTRTKVEADEMATLLGCRSYHADISSMEEKAQIISSWALPGGGPFLVGTSGLGAGLDYPHIRVVMHVDEPYGLIEFMQESGRGGRDGASAESVVILRHGWRPGSQLGLDPNETSLHQYLESKGCRRSTIEIFMDGVDGITSCPPQTTQCDRCQDGVQEEAPLQVGVRMKKAEAEGPRALLRQARIDQDEMEIYHGNLEAIKGQCILCRIYGKDDWQHSFSKCRQVKKWEYIHAKREVLRRTRHKWIRSYDACFHCFQPQVLCSRHEQGSCRYEDLIMQGVFGLCQVVSEREWLQREFQISFREATEWLTWAGGSNELGGIVCIQGVVVLHRLLLRYSS